MLTLVASLVWMTPPARADLSTAEIDRAFARMYNTDFRGAHESIDRYVSAQPADPLGYAVRASAYLFSELDRLGILESEFFGNDKHSSSRPSRTLSRVEPSSWPPARTIRMRCSPWPSRRVSSWTTPHWSRSGN